MSKETIKKAQAELAARRAAGTLKKPETTHKADLSDREREFCRHYVACGDIKKAYALAGYKPQRTPGKILKRPHVAAYIAMIRGKALEKLSTQAAYSIEQIMIDLERDRQLAYDTGNATAAARCTELKGKVHGLIIEKQEVKNLTPLSINIGLATPTLPAPAELPAIDVTHPALPNGQHDDDQL